MYYQTTSCTTQVYRTCAGGCDGDVCKMSTSTLGTIDIPKIFATTSSSTTIVNNNTNENNNTSIPTSRSITDILRSIVFPTFTSTDIGTATPLSLSTGTRSISSLSPRATSTNPFANLATGTITSVQPTQGQTTFTSSDLSGSQTFSGAQQNSALFSILENMRQTLLNALMYLRSLL